VQGNFIQSKYISKQNVRKSRILCEQASKSAIEYVSQFHELCKKKPSEMRCYVWICNFQIHREVQGTYSSTNWSIQ